MATMFTEPPSRPDLRHPPRPEPATYRTRIALDDSWPPIWRRLDLRCDLPLDVVHQAIQAAFNWDDYHLYRFSLGGRAFDRNSQSFLCGYDTANREFEDDDGLPAADVRLDQTLHNPGDVLHYVYDYGDNWELTLTLDEVRPALDDSPAAALVDGKQAAPPEDCGGLRTATDLADVVEDPAHFPADDIRRALRGPFFVSYEAGLDPHLLELFQRREPDPDRLARLIAGPTTLPDDELTAGLRAHRWFLDRAADGGIALTAAGYLKPADVVEAAKIVPAMGDWIGSHNREVQSAPILDFRESLQSMGLLRKYKGRLVLTKAGAAAQRDPVRLWTQLAQRLCPTEADSFDGQAGLLLLSYAGSAQDGVLPLDEIVAVLNDFGWRHGDGTPLRGYELYRLPQYDALVNVADTLRTQDRRGRISAAASTLARAALRRRAVGTEGLPPIGKRPDPS